MNWKSKREDPHAMPSSLLTPAAKAGTWRLCVHPTRLPQSQSRPMTDGKEARFRTNTWHLRVHVLKDRHSFTPCKSLFKRPPSTRHVEQRPTPAAPRSRPLRPHVTGGAKAAVSTRASTRAPGHRRASRPLTLQERQAGVELGGAVAEVQAAARGPWAPAGCRHVVLLKQNCNHL